MNQFVTLLLAALLGGVTAGATIHFLRASQGGSASLDGEGAKGQAADLQQEILALRKQMRDWDVGREPQLRASAPAAAGAGAQGAISQQVIDALAERIESTVKTSVNEAMEAKSESSATPPRRRRKRVSLAEAAEEMRLSAQETDDLKELYEGIREKAISIVAGEDGDPDEVRRDLESVRNNPAKAMEMLPKYMPKFISNMGKLMPLESERRAGTKRILGDERAKELEQNYALEEQDPFGLRMNIGATR